MNKMNKWISIKDDLPYYDWVVVCAYHPEWNDGLWGRFAIARYIPSEGFGWEFFDDKEMTGCPACGDAGANMGIEEITHWMQLTFPGEENE